MILAATPLGPAARGQDTATEAGWWTLGFSALTDNESNHSVGASFDVAVADSTWLSTSAGSSRSPRSRADVSATTFVVGIDHRFGLFGVRAELERWGDADAVESHDSRVTLSMHTDRVSLELGTERRDIDIVLALTGLDGRSFTRNVPLSARGTSVAVRIAASDRVAVRLGLQDYDYPPGVDRLPRVDSLSLLSGSTLTLANSFVSKVATAGIDIEIGRKVLGFGLSHDRSAIDRGELDSAEAALMMPIGARLDLELRLGRSSSAWFDSATYGGVALVIYGGD